MRHQWGEHHPAARIHWELDGCFLLLGEYEFRRPMSIDRETDVKP